MDLRFIVALVAGVLAIAVVLLVGTGTVPGVLEAPQTLPAQYDLRDVDGRCYMTPVRMQAGMLPDGQPDIGNCIGSCWAFSACAAFESNLLLQGIISDPASPAANLSVWHMANYNGYNHPVYHFNPEIGPDGVFSFGYTESEPVIRGWAGDHRFAIDYMISGRGPVLDRYAPFPLDDIQEKKNLTSPPEHLSVAYMLREALVFPRFDYATDDEYREAVKHALLQHGALESYQYADPSMYPGQEESPIFDRITADYYFNGTSTNDFPVSLGHAVTIAGWDDARVISGAPEPGAWLVKNSLGKAFGNDGYFWISYADAVFLKGDDMAVAFIADSGEGYDGDHMYQTSAGALSDVSTGLYDISWDYLSDGFAATGGESWACGRFTAEEDASLRAVGFMTLNRDETVTIAIYGGWDNDGTRPDPARLLESETFRVPERGYHLVDLGRLVPLEEGDEFVIVIGFAALDEAAEGIEPLVYVASATPQADKTFRSLSNPADGESAWEDYATLHNGSIFFVQGFTAA